MKKVKLVSAEEIVLEDYTPKKLGVREVSLEIKYCGICGSDMHVYLDKHPFTTFPIVPGHECGGIIRELGKKSKEFRLGQKATFIPQMTCGQCYNCKIGKYNICDNLKVIGFQTDGAMKEVFNVNSDLLVPLPNDFNLKEASLIEPLAVAVHATRIIGEIENRNLIVLGGGTIGQLITQVAKIKGASKVLTTDVNNFRLKLADRLGADFTVNAAELDRDYVKKKFGERGAEVIFEAVGKEETIRQAIELIRKGGRICVVGVFGEEVSINIAKVQDQEITIQGSSIYFKEDFQYAVELLQSKSIKVKPLISKIFMMKDAKDAFEAAKASTGPPKVLLKI